LRAKEISDIRGSMVTDAQDTDADTIHLFNGASKGKRGVVWLSALSLQIKEARYQLAPFMARQ
jgi:hypothetical protein